MQNSSYLGGVQMPGGGSEQNSVYMPSGGRGPQSMYCPGYAGPRYFVGESTYLPGFRGLPGQRSIGGRIVYPGYGGGSAGFPGQYPYGGQSVPGVGGFPGQRPLGPTYPGMGGFPGQSPFGPTYPGYGGGVGFPGPTGGGNHNFYYA